MNLRLCLALAALTFAVYACGSEVPAAVDSSTNAGGGDDAAMAGDAATADDAGIAPDAGLDPDAGTRSDAGGSDAGTTDGGSPLEGRSFSIRKPAGYDATKPSPLVVLLHGYTATAGGQDAYFGLSTLADKEKFLLALPEGTRDRQGNQFWNATDACCNFNGSTVDDVAFLRALVKKAQADFNVDAKRIFFVGHSNGAFMSHRFACENADLVAGFVALAGDNWKDPSRCSPSGPLAVLQVHGDNDQTIVYTGGSNSYPFVATLPPYPAARDSVGTWAAKFGCASSLSDTGTRLDLLTTLPGSETKVEEFKSCPSGATVELWTIQGGSHIPGFNSNWAPTIYDFLMKHPKP